MATTVSSSTDIDAAYHKVQKSFVQILSFIMCRCCVHQTSQVFADFYYFLLCFHATSKFGRSFNGHLRARKFHFNEFQQN